MDMGGNVMEWTATPYARGSAGSMLLRGGAWTRRARVYAAVYHRSLGARRGLRDNDVGIRLVQDIPAGKGD
jgi:formylglycine-generating enzyme required for sulfatase activity